MKKRIKLCDIKRIDKNLLEAYDAGIITKND